MLSCGVGDYLSNPYLMAGVAAPLYIIGLLNIASGYRLICEPKMLLLLLPLLDSFLLRNLGIATTVYYESCLVNALIESRFYIPSA
jgi:hypothetical protein